MFRCLKQRQSCSASNYLSSDFEHVHTLEESIESKLFNTVLSNPHHVLYQLLPHEKDIGYNLRQRSHSHSVSSPVHRTRSKRR